MEKGLFKFSIRDITEIAIMCALAIAFDRFLNIKIGASGGSISIACLPLFIVALRHGWFKGCVAGGIVFGLTTCLLDGYGFQYYPFDYFIGFGCIGVAGLFGKQAFSLIKSEKTYDKVFGFVYIFITVLLHFIIRTLAASIDSMIFYELSFGASLAYNIGYCGPSAIAVLIFLYLLTPAILAINIQYPTEFLKEDKKEIVEEKED